MKGIKNLAKHLSGPLFRSTERRCLSQASLRLSRRMGTKSKIVSCDLSDVKIPELTFSEMCWSRMDQYKDNAALVRKTLMCFDMNMHFPRLMQLVAEVTLMEKQGLWHAHLVVVF